MIELKEVTKIFNQDLLKSSSVVLNKLSYKIPEGAITGFIGANGAGKSTSIKIIFDFIRPTSGEVVFSKKIGGSFKNAIKNIGLLPERPFFYSNLTGREFLVFLGKLSLIKYKDIDDRITKYSKTLQIDFALDRKIKFYSKGMLQRLGFLGAVIHRPKVVILDEPAAGLDPLGRKQIKDFIIDLKNEGITIFFSTHILADVEDVCDRIVFIKNGVCEFEGLLESLIKEKSDDQMIVKYSSLKDKSQIFNVKIDKNLLHIKLNELLSSNQYMIESIKPYTYSLEQLLYKTNADEI